MNRYSKLLILFAIIFTVALVNFEPKNIPSTKADLTNYQYMKKFAASNSFINEAMAANLTSETFPSAGWQGAMVRFMYFLINTGPPSGTVGVNSNGWWDDFQGPTNNAGTATGFLGMIAEIMGPDALGGGLSDGGYSTCSSLPATGSTAMVEGSGDTYTMTFGTPGKSVPSGYTDKNDAISAGTGSYEKRVSVAFQASGSGTNTTFMDVEFNCSNESGWLLFFEPGVAQASARNIEAYYDTTTSTAALMELAMYYDGGSADERFLVKFATESSTVYNFSLTRVETTGSVQGFRIAVRGDTSSPKSATAFMLFESGTFADTATTVTAGSSVMSGGDLNCLTYDAATEVASGVSGACSSLSLTAAGAPAISSGGDFSISWVGNSLKSSFSALP